MKIIAIETSCDETAISIIDTKEKTKNPSFSVLSNIVLSQAKLHARYGGVFPSLAKREHAKNLIPVLKQALQESGFLNVKIKSQKSKLQSKTQNEIDLILEREPELLEQFKKFIPTLKKPPIDAVAVTYGPGLEPALWVGINFAKALSLAWDIPVISINHMEGHLFSALLKTEKRNSKSQIPSSKQIQNAKHKIQDVEFPVLALLISGGHTELVLSKNWFEYKIVGQTRDDAVGETFDKAARMLGLPYPGGPAISDLARKWKTQISNFKSQKNSNFKFPRPMINSGNLDFSFSGLKTSVLYTVKKISKLTENIKKEIAYELEEAIADVLVKKTIVAAEKFNVKTILVGGGVSANTRIKESLAEETKKILSDTEFLVARTDLTGDNALMIAAVAYTRMLHGVSKKKENIAADGNVRLGSES